MMLTIFQRWHLPVALTCLMLTATGRGQGALHWTSYKVADGLSEPVFNSVSVTPQGKILATSPNAPLAAELDGYTVTNFPAPPGGLGRIGESPGGQRWAVVPRGLMEYQRGAWKLHPVPEIEAAGPKTRESGGGLPFIPVRQGTVLFLTPQALLEYSEEDPACPQTEAVCSAAESGIGALTGMAPVGDDGLWITGLQGAAFFAGPIRNLRPGSRPAVFLPPSSWHLGPLSEPVPEASGGLVVLAQSTVRHDQVVVTFDGHTWRALPAGPHAFNHAWLGPENSLWAATTNGLFYWAEDSTNWLENEEISPSRIDDVAVESGGAFWLATADGLRRGTSPLWRKPAGMIDLNGQVSCLTATPDGTICFLAGDTLHVVHNKIFQTFALPPELGTGDESRHLYALKDGSVLVEAAGALEQFKCGDGSFHSVANNDPTKPVKILGLLPDGSAGVYHGGPNGFLDSFDGNAFRPWPNPPALHNTEEGLATCFTMRKGDLWLGGAAALWRYHNDRWQRFAADDSTAPGHPVGFAEMPDGKTWCATPGTLWEFDGQNWLLLQIKFNHINALLQTRAGDVWLASNGGLSRYCGGAWIDCSAGDGLPNGAVNDLCEGIQGQIWAATAKGPVVFHPEVDPDPPQAPVLRVVGNSQHLSAGDTLNLLFEGVDKWKYSPRDSLLFSHQTDQTGWSVFRDGTACSLAALAAGHHSLTVRAMDHNGNISAATVYDFAVLTPWFQETRLWIILLLGVATALFFAAVAWHRHRQLVRSYAMVEQTVAERTRELEIATRELLHSQKMNALGTLAAGIAHDFNNILSIIKGSAQIIEDHPDQPEKIRTRVARIKTVVQQGAEIVEAMLGFSRTSPSPPAPCDINTVVADTIKLLGDRFLRATEVSFARADDLPEMAVSREFIQQILINLIFNAAEAMNEDKQITVTTARVNRLPPDIFLHPATAESFVLISVRDQGSGMTPEIQTRIFEPFFTTKSMSSRRGTGLGLSMVYELAKKMGAGLAVHSVLGHGSEFTLILPVTPRPVEKATPAESTTLTA